MSHTLSPAPPPQHRDAPIGPGSLVALLAERAATAPDRPAVVDGLPPAGGPRLEWTWGDLAAAALRVADALERAGLERGDRVAHMGPHGPEWVAVDLACLLAGLVHVAIHPDMPRAERDALCDWLAPRGIVASGPGAARSLGGRGAILVDAARELSAAGWRAEAGRELDVRLDRRARDCDPDACCTILLSSGTTGRVHGVLHSQRTLATNAAAAAAVFLDAPEDVRLSWLPASHSLARTGDLYTALVRGACLNVVRDRTRLLEACATLPPTVVLGVPAFFERLERGVKSGRIADLAATLGGRVRTCISGGAPLRRRTAECFAACGVPLVEGYGLAEAGPVVTVATPRNARPGTVGPPLPGVEVRIDDRAGSVGQVLVRTPSRALDVIHPPGSEPVESPVGWLATGDTGAIDPDGHLRITGRLRDTLVLSTGVKLPPAEVERALAEDEAVAQVCVVGDGLPAPVALVVPEPGAVRTALARMGVLVASRRAALRHPRLRAWFERRLARRQRDLPRAWRARRVVLVGRAFDAAHGEATESFKLRRPAIARHFQTPVAAALARASAAAAPPRQPWIAAPVWSGGSGGFAPAAAAAAAPLDDATAAVVEAATATLDRLRAEGALYEPSAAPPRPAPPLVDAPPSPNGTFSRAAEDALGDVGLWGLAVPEEHGGGGAGMLSLARAVAQLAADCPTAAGMLAVHSTIGAVSAVAAFGAPEQQGRHLPGLAAGRPLSIFAGTEPEVGCDLAAVRTTLERRGTGLALVGTKMFITGAAHGRLAKVLAVLDGRPAVALVRLPDADTATFRLRTYALHPLKHARNAALEFTGLPVDEADVLAPPDGRDGMHVVWHGLNRGRVTLAAQAAGTLRLLLGHARDHARRRTTWGRPIADRELVQGRLGRIAAGIAACDAVAAWAAAAIDAGGTGEIEAIAAKIVASACVREAALDALGVHGGRAFLVGHPLGDALHDHLAVTVYEGESDLLALALMKGLCRHHPLAGTGAGPRRAAAWLAWRAGLFAAGSAEEDRSILDARLRGHARRARRQLARAAARIDAAIRRHGRALAERQLEVGAVAAEVRDCVAALATAHHGDAQGTDAAADAADVWCRLALARAGRRRLAAADHAAVAALGRANS